MAAAGEMSTTLYHDLCAEIDILEVRIHDLEGEYQFWYKACHRGGLPLDTCLERMKGICDQVEVYSSILEGKEKTRKEIEKRLLEFEGIEGKVAYMRHIEGRSLPEIAAELGYSYHWIAKLSSRTGYRKGKKSTKSG